MGQRLRVPPIRLRQAPGGAGEIAHLAGIDHRHWEVGNAQLRHEWRLVPPGRLDYDHAWAECLQPGDGFGDPRCLIGQMPLFAAWANCHIQRRLGHIDPNDYVLRLAHTSPLCSLITRTSPTLQDTGSAHGWPRQLFGLIGARGATTQAHLRPQGTEGSTVCRAHVQCVTATYYMTLEIQGIRPKQGESVNGSARSSSYCSTCFP